MLGPILRRESAHTACEHAVRAAILAGELQPGARLPPERELAITLGVSRLTLRAALATLSATGLIAVRHGSGYLVRDFRDGGPDLLPELLALAHDGERQAVIADLLRVRRHLAAAILDALIEPHVRGPALATIAAAVDRFDTLAGGGATLEELAVADLAVVAALVDAAPSPVLRLCFNPILAVVGSDPVLRAALYAEPRTNVAGYRLLLVWLAHPRREQIPTLVGALAAHDLATLAWLDRQASLKLRKPRRARRSR